MQLFFNPELQHNSTSIVFDKEESRHIVRVLRKKEGDTLHITNGKGDLFTAEIQFANDKKCNATLINVQSHKKTWDFYVHIALAPTKNNDRTEWFLEKATEMGIDEITPIICHHSERRNIKLDRFEKIIQSAMKQSLKYHQPVLNQPIGFSEFMAQHSNEICCIAHCEEGPKKTLKDHVKPKENVIILIGPEGDFSPQEIAMAIKQKYQPISLGASRLRTETAALVALQHLHFINA